MASDKIGDLYYNLDDANSKATVTYEKYTSEYDKNYSALIDVVVPSSVTYNEKEYAVTAIGSRAFDHANHIKSIHLPATIETIGSFAFNYDTALTEINIPEGITVLDEGIFYYAKVLANIQLPKSLTTIKRQAFSSAVGLETITIPENVDYIDNQAFYYAKNLKSVICKRYSKPNTLGTQIFDYTHSELTVYVPCGRTSNYSGFAANIKDTMVYDIDVIAEHADVKIDTAECKNITISLENIDPAYAFINWSNGETETSFEKTVTMDFKVTANFRKIPAVGDTIQYEYKGNNLYYMITYKNSTLKEVTIVNDGTSAMAWTESNKPTGALVIPDSVEDWQGTKYAVAYMYSNAFRNCTGITSVDFSENKGLTYITAHGFEDCTALAEVTLSDYITTLNSYCFKGCTSLTTIDFKNVVTLSGPTNFWDCNIALVHITKSLKTIPDQTDLFDHATTITCDEENPYFVAVDNVLYSKDTTQIYGLPIGLTTAEVHVPTTVTKVLYAAFYQFEGTLFINSEIKPTWPSTGGDWRNSPKGDVIVGCGLYDYYNAWRGNENNFQNITSLTEQFLWNVDAHAATHGSVAILDTADCSKVTILATPDEGYVFNSWSNGLKDAEITINVDRDTTITAYFNKLITNVELSISQLPKLNETRGENSFAASVAEDADYEIKDWRFIDDADLWTGDPTDIFTPGLYAVNVCIKPKSGFVFPVTDLNIADVSKITATVNGETPDQVHGGWEGVPVLYLSTDFTISDATGIEQITNDKSQTTKIIKDNQLFILRGDKVYTITGQEVK